MADYDKIYPAPAKENDQRSLAKAIDDIRRALKQIYKKLDDLENNKQDKS